MSRSHTFLFTLISPLLLLALMLNSILISKADSGSVESIDSTNITQLPQYYGVESEFLEIGMQEDLNEVYTSSQKSQLVPEPIYDSNVYSIAPTSQENRCPSNDCEFTEGTVLIKFSDTVAINVKAVSGNWTDIASLNNMMQTQSILNLQPVFPTANSPRFNESVESPLGEQLPKPDLTRWYRAELASDADVFAVIDTLMARPDIAYAEPDYLRRPIGGLVEPLLIPHLSVPLAIPGSGSDPLYDQQWHLPAANVPAAWQWLEDNGYEPGGNRDIVVAVIDTGIDYNHPDLAANMWINTAEFSGTPGVDDDSNGYIDDIYGADTVTPDGNPIDDHGHGTHVAGIIGAQANNGIGGVGVAYNVQIMSLKAAQSSGVLSSSDIAEALFYAVEKGADVINMSFGGYAHSQIEEDALAVAFSQAVLVAAAGNDSKVNMPCDFGQNMYPASYSWVLGVMAHNQFPDADGDYLAGFSNYDCRTQDTNEYELMAPGVDIWSTLPNGIYASWDGTSMSTPIVSGIAALVRTTFTETNSYSSRFVMGQLAATGPLLQAYTPVLESPVSFRVADALVALTNSPQPELAYLEHHVLDNETINPQNDNDGIVDAGETVDLGITIKNHWGKADPVTVTLTAMAKGAVLPDPYVTMITDTVNYGAVGSFNQDDNGLIYDGEGILTGVNHPFRFSIPITTPNNHVIAFQLTITAENGINPADPSAPFTFQSYFDLTVQRGTEVYGAILTDTTWAADKLYLVTSNILVSEGVTLTIEPGTEIRFDMDKFLLINGKLLASGTIDNPIIFTSNEVSPMPGDWGGITLDGTNSIIQFARIFYAVHGVTVIEPAVVEYSEIAYGGPYAIQTGIYIYGAADGAVIAHNYIHDIGYLGIWSFGDAIIRNNLIVYNGTSNKGHSGGIEIRGSSQVYSNTIAFNNLENTSRTIGGVVLENPVTSTPILSSNNIFSNGIWDVFLESNASDLPAANNWWGTTNTNVIDVQIRDFNDEFDTGIVTYQPILSKPSSATPPIVSTLTLSPLSPVGAELITTTLDFSSPMTTTIEPDVTFGPTVPYTDFRIKNGQWISPTQWVGSFLVTPATGDGIQTFRIASAKSADGFFVIPKDTRFKFEIITSGTEAMNLQATGGEGYVDLAWTQDDFDLLSGFNIYRSTSLNGTYTQINPVLIPPEERMYRDTDVQPGQPYYYKFTIVKSDMTESDFSNVATGTPIDTIDPVISHTPVTEASPGLPLTLFADVTDNVAVQNVTLYYRQSGNASYISEMMINTTGDRYSATLVGSLISSPGLDYYITADDGISTVFDGRPEDPHQVTVVDQPIVTTVTPNHGPDDGSTIVTISGSNFKAGATVTFGGAVAANVTLISSSQLTATTPAHFATVVDVVVTNSDSQSGTLLNGYTYESDSASISLPDSGGGQNDVVQIPINAANIQGLASVDVTISFDSAVLDGLSASTGSLTSGWSTAVNTTTPGELQISMASPGGTVTGDGVLANLEIDVIGSPGMTTTLHVDSISLNDGAIPTEIADGSFTVDLVYEISGTIQLWNGGIISGTLLTLDGAQVYSGFSDANGTYTVSSIETGDYMLTPSKSDDVNGISALDASLVLQHASGLITLTGHEATAADVNKSGDITSFDAFNILQKAVDLIALPFQGAGVVWEFDPFDRNYTNLNSNLSSQDFTAVLLGDVSGNWMPNQLQNNMLAATTNVATLALPEVTAVPGEQITVPLSLSLDEGQIYGADITLDYDPEVLSIVLVENGDLAEGWAIASNLELPGTARVSLASATPMTTSGELLSFVFEATGEAGENSELTLSQGDLNENDIATTLTHGNFEIDIPVPDAPEIAISQLELDTVFSWSPVTYATEYHIYRSEVPYFTPTVPYAIVSTRSFTDVGVVEDGVNQYYLVTAVNEQGEESIVSNRIGLFNIQVLPGWNLLAWPLLPTNTTLDGILSTQLYGTDDPQTADRILVWHNDTQNYESAWFCGGACLAWGEPWANHWLANDYSQSNLTLKPDNGFWVQNRSGITETIVLLGNVTEENRTVSVGQGWQQIGSSFPLSKTLDNANIPATGTEDPQTADRILYWDAVSQNYESAWYCSDPCIAWGEPWANHWLANDYSQSPIALLPGHGFWYQNRFDSFVWNNSK